MLVENMNQSQTESVRSLVMVRRIRKDLTVLLGALWLLDGLLQLQPYMFSSGFAIGVIGGSLMSLPRPLYVTSVYWLEHLLIPDIVLWNSLFAGLQLALGVMLLVGISRTRLAKLALWISIPWSIALWVFGEGMGGILLATMSGGEFPGTPSILNGFPGAALLYLWVTILLLIPESWWGNRSKLSPVWGGAGYLFLVAAIVQAAPLMWTAFGQASIFAANLDNLPGALAWTIRPVINAATSHPVLANSIEVGVSLVTALTLFLRKPSTLLYLLPAAWVTFIWWFGLGVGGTLTGLGTDPNSPPLIILLVLPTWLSLSASHKRFMRESKF